MAIPKEKFREIVFQILFCSDYTEEIDDGILDLVMVKCKVSKANVRLARDAAIHVRNSFAKLDPLIEEKSREYSFERISKIEKNILRLGLYELFFDEEIPAKVAISEAIRLCRKFSTPEGAKFVNAILDESHKDVHFQKQIS